MIKMLPYKFCHNYFQNETLKIKNKLCIFLTMYSQEYAVILLVIGFLIQTDIISLLREMYTSKKPQYQTVMSGSLWAYKLVLSVIIHSVYQLRPKSPNHLPTEYYTFGSLLCKNYELANLIMMRMDLCIIADCLHKIFNSHSLFPSNLSLPSPTCKSENDA